MNETLARRHACWLAQQATEKALKALLILHGLDFPLRHDLDLPRDLLPAECATRQAFRDLADLTEWAVEARYPGEAPEATGDDATEAVERARAVLESVRTDFQAKLGDISGS